MEQTALKSSSDRKIATFFCVDNNKLIDIMDCEIENWTSKAFDEFTKGSFYFLYYGLNIRRVLTDFRSSARLGYLDYQDTLIFVSYKKEYEKMIVKTVKEFETGFRKILFLLGLCQFKLFRAMLWNKWELFLSESSDKPKWHPVYQYTHINLKNDIRHQNIYAPIEKVSKFHELSRLWCKKHNVYACRCECMINEETPYSQFEEIREEYYGDKFFNVINIFLIELLVFISGIFIRMK